MKATVQSEQREGLRHNEEKWSRTLMEAGWTALPSVILERQQALGLDPTDLNILLQLARHWWYRDQPPHPSKKTIAACIGVDVSTVRRRIARLEADGLISREARFSGKDRRQVANFYHFEGLIREATPYAQEAIETRRARKKEDAERVRRKRPKLAIVRAADGSGE
jgi:DNA-binding MarR family transcriptional regulator